MGESRKRLGLQFSAVHPERRLWFNQRKCVKTILSGFQRAESRVVHKLLEDSRGLESVHAGKTVARLE